MILVVGQFQAYVLTRNFANTFSVRITVTNRATWLYSPVVYWGDRKSVSVSSKEAAFVTTGLDLEVVSFEGIHHNRLTAAYHVVAL